MVNQSLVLLINLCSENRHNRQAQNGIHRINLKLELLLIFREQTTFTNGSENARIHESYVANYQWN
ncbi:MAG: hypothetical protein IPH88_03800 [Bacteroidales bacterium]|nr:hypothetical protein [Bacteroidales bacterium]